MNRHQKYLRSPEWKARKIKALRRDGYICQACHDNSATEVHHTTYKHWGNEPLWELQSVCRACHQSITDMDKGKKPPGHTTDIIGSHDGELAY